MLISILQALSKVEDILDKRVALTDRLLNHEINLQEYKEQSIVLDTKLKQLRDSNSFDFVDPFSQEAVIEQAEEEALKDYSILDRFED